MLRHGTPLLRANLLGQFRAILGLTLLGILAVTGCLVYVQEQRQYDALVTQLENRFFEKSQSLGDIFEQYAEAVDGLRLKAEGFLHHPPASAPTPLYQWLTQQPPGTPVTLDALPEPLRRGPIGNLTGTLPAATDASGLGLPDREVEMALYLNDRFAGIAYAVPEVAWAAYISAAGFINLFPSVPASRYHYGAQDDSHSRLLAALGTVQDASSDERRFDQSRYWSDLHLDDGGQGPVMTVAQPVFESGRLRGVVALDITTAALEARVRGWREEIGEVLVVGRDGRLLARSDIPSAADRNAPAPPPAQVAAQVAAPAPPPAQTSTPATRAPTLPAALADALPEGLAPLATLWTLPVQPLASVTGRYLVYSVRLAHAPVAIVHIIPLQALYFQMLESDWLLLAAGLGGLALLLVVATQVTDRQIIRPSQRLLEFIGRQSREEEAPIPPVPPAWQPWFERIGEAFASYSQLVAIRQELEIARVMQRSIQPTKVPRRPDLQLSCRMQPAKFVGGDFYDFFWLDRHRIGIVIADVAGKGIAGALFMVMARTVLRSEALRTHSPGLALARTNDHLESDNESVTFVTVFYGILDVSTGELVFANAGHLAPLVIAPNGTVGELALTGGVPLGIARGVAFTDRRQHVAAGATLVLITDGVTEAFSRQGEQYGDERLQTLLHGTSGDDVEVIADRMFGALEAHVAGIPQSDDWTCLLLRYCGPKETGEPPLHPRHRTRITV